MNILIQDISYNSKFQQVYYNSISKYEEHPLSFLSNSFKTPYNMMHYKFVEQQPISGIADCIQIYYSYTIYPKSCNIALHFRFVNITSFELSNIKCSLCLSSGAEIDLQNRFDNSLKIAGLPPKQTKMWTVSVKLNQFSDCQGFLNVIFLRGNNRWKHKVEV